MPSGAASRPDLLSLGKYFGVAYLTWLAIGMWRGGSTNAVSNEQKTAWFAYASAGIVFFATDLPARQFNGIIVSPSLTKLFGRITAAMLAVASVWMLSA